MATRIVITPILGAACLIEGIGLIFRAPLRRFVWVPFLVNLFLFGLTLWYGIGQIAGLVGWIDGFLPSWLHWLRWLVMPFLMLGMVLLLFSTFTIVANLIAAPFNSRLSAEVEGLITGQRPIPESFSGAVGSELGKIVYLIKWIILFLLLLFVPLVNTLISPLWFVFCAWMIAMEYGDYPMANHAMNGRAVRIHLRRHWGGSLGFGLAVMVLMMVPVVNFITMPAAVAGATVFWLKTCDNRNRPVLPTFS